MTRTLCKFAPRFSLWTIAACCAACLAAAMPAFAAASSTSATTSTTASAGGWQFEATPYIWGAGIDGEAGIGRLPAGGVEASFSDIVKVLDFAVMGVFEARTGRWGILADGMYFDMSDTKPTPDALFGDAEVHLTEQIYSGAGAYRVLEGDVAVDVLAGARVVMLDTDLELTGGVAAGRHVAKGVSWLDAFGGARVTYHPTPKWSVRGLLDVGGGGSKLTWQAVAGAGYQFNKLVSLQFGYRYLSIDYDQDGLVWDTAMAGFYAGVGFHF